MLILENIKLEEQVGKITEKCYQPNAKLLKKQEKTTIKAGGSTATKMWTGWMDGWMGDTP